MSAFVNDRDVLIQSTVPRYLVSVVEKALLLAVDTPVFAVSAGGSAMPAAITITATLVSITGAVEFSVSPGAALTVDGQVATLQFADMGADVVFVQAKVKDAESGVEFLRSAVISKVFDGAAGATYYTWVKYADSAAGAGLSDDPAGKGYIGLAYNKTTPVEGTNPADYTWSLIKGTDGVPGAPGADGLTTFTWIKYSDFPDGTNPYDVPTAATLYLGLATNKTTAAESGNKADYTWSKFKGDQGVPGTAAPTLYTWLKYADSAAGAGLSDDPTGKTFIGFAYNKATSVEGTNPADYAWALMKGADGVPGGKGADGQTLYTWLKYADFPDGTGLYDLPGPTTMYVGLSVNRTVQSESGNKEDYVWSKFRGDQGVPGTTGPQGQRGTKTVVAGGYSTWSDASAVAELAAAGFGAPINRDVVTLYGPVNSSPTFTMTKFFDNGSWLLMGTHMDGGLLVNGTVAAQALSVDRLSALSANLGNVTAGDMYGTTLHGGPGYLTNAFAWPANGLGGFYLGPEGLLLGNYFTGKYVQLGSDGYVAMPGFTVVNGAATFSGALAGASGSFSGNVVTGSGTGFRVEMGPDDPVYVMWAGSGVKNDVNAIFYLKRDGSGYFGGSLSAGTLKTAVTNPEINPNAQLVDGPFGSNGGAINVVCSLSWIYARASTRDKYTAGAGTNTATITLYRTIGNGAELAVQSSTFSGPTEIINTLAPEEKSTCQQSIQGSFTYMDTAASTQNRTYRAVLSLAMQDVTAAPRPGGAGSADQDIVVQRLTLITTE